jgi:hypothetical protein
LRLIPTRDLTNSNLVDDASGNVGIGCKRRNVAASMSSSAVSAGEGASMKPSLIVTIVPLSNRIWVMGVGRHRDLSFRRATFTAIHDSFGFIATTVKRDWRYFHAPIAQNSSPARSCDAQSAF